MNGPDLNEAVSLVTDVVIPALLSTIGGGTATGVTGAQLRYLCGVLAVNAGTQLALSPGNVSFWISLAQCFDAAQAISTVTFNNMEAVRVACDAATPTGAPAKAVKNFSVRMSLAEQAKILAATTFTSRQSIDNIFNVIDASFDEAIRLAADNQDNVVYVALITMQAAVSNDLATRALPLPKLVAYNFTRQRSSLAMAQSLYQDPTRSDELIAENRPIRPLFMPLTGIALSD